MEDAREHMQNVIQSLLLLNKKSATCEKESLNVILDNLNALNCEQFANVEENVVSSLLQLICLAVPPSEPFLVSKTCKLITRVVRKRLTSSECIDVFSWLIKTLKECSNMILEDILEALYIVLKRSSHHTPKVYEDLIGKNGVLLRFVQANLDNVDRISKKNIENPYFIDLGVIKCILALTTIESSQQNERKQIGVEILQRCADIALRFLYNNRKRDQNEINFCDILVCAFNVLIQVYSYNNEVVKNLGEVIGACRCWMLYALEGCESVTPQKVMPSQQTLAEIPTPPKNKGGKQIKLRKHRNPKPIQSQSKSWRENSSENVLQLDTPLSASQITGYTAANISAIQIDNVPMPRWANTSESDMSDSENGRLAKLKSAQAKTRLAALNLLSVTIRTSEKHLVFGYWWALLPGEAGGCRAGGGLAVSIQREPSASARTAAFTALLSLVTVSRSYLTQAEMGKRTTTSFTPFSVSLGHSLENMHCLLRSSLTTERSISVLVVILKCVVACIQATPYKRFEGQLLIEIIKSVKNLLIHKDWTIQVAALIIMGCVVSIDPPVPEISNILINSNDNPTITEYTQNFSIGGIIKNVHKVQLDEIEKNVIDYGSDEYSEEEPEPNVSLVTNSIGSKFCTPSDKLNLSPETIASMSWLIERCFENLGWTFKNSTMELSKGALVPIRLESLQVLSAVALKHFEFLLAPYVNIMTEMLCLALRESVASLSLHAAKCVSSMGDAMQKLVVLSGTLANDCLSFWTCMLQGPLTELLQSDQNPPARAIACDCISSIGEATFNRLPEKLKILSAILLLGCSGDEDPIIGAAAVRALAVCIMYRHWREDAGLISDCGESVLRVLDEAVPAVKVKATWALANITDALLLNIEDPEIERVDNNLLLRLLDESIGASKDNDKIKVNAMRSIGNIMLLLNKEDLKSCPRLQKSSISGIERLIYCASNGNNMKVRWNACHGLGKAMKNEALHVHSEKWQSDVFNCLCNLMEKCRNLKVRAHAATALRAPPTRLAYGDSFYMVWRSVFTAMDSAQHVDDFSEYKHKDNLVEQLCITLAHLSCLLTCEDLSTVEISEPTSFLCEETAQLVQQVGQRTEPQGGTCAALLEAAKYVTTQLHAEQDTQRECLNMLQNMFVWET